MPSTLCEIESRLEEFGFMEEDPFDFEGCDQYWLIGDWRLGMSDEWLEVYHIPTRAAWILECFDEVLVEVTELLVNAQVHIIEVESA